MFKQFTLASLILLTTFPAVAKTDLPFIGTRHYNFMGGSGTGQSINISKSGYTTIKLHGKSSTAIIYQGVYKKMIPAYDNENYFMIIGNNAITMLDNKGNQLFGCSGEETEACVKELYK